MKNVYIDIDNVICTSDSESDGPEDYSYPDAQPIQETIDRVNALYDSGQHHITYWTARGTETGRDWTKLTKRQLDEWGCKYHNLEMGKPAFDVFIDDKAFNVKQFIDDEVNFS